MATNRIRKMAELMAWVAPDKFKVGCVIYSGHMILGTGYNSMSKVHPKSRHPYKTVHAETAAIIDAARRLDTYAAKADFLRGARVYVYRAKKDGSPGLAAPCSHCAATLAHVGIRRVEYSC